MGPRYQLNKQRCSLLSSWVGTTLFNMHHSREPVINYYTSLLPPWDARHKPTQEVDSYYLPWSLCYNELYRSFISPSLALHSLADITHTYESFNIFLEPRPPEVP